MPFPSGVVQRAIAVAPPLVPGSSDPVDGLDRVLASNFYALCEMRTDREAQFVGAIPSAPPAITVLTVWDGRVLAWDSTVERIRVFDLQPSQMTFEMELDRNCTPRSMLVVDGVLLVACERIGANQRREATVLLRPLLPLFSFFRPADRTDGTE
jgi:hypothetical protein